MLRVLLTLMLVVTLIPRGESQARAAARKEKKLEKQQQKETGNK